MKTELTNRESQRATELANEYKKKGYAVVVPRSVEDVPPFLRGSNYIPDLIATSKEEKLIIEVKSSATIKTVDALASISELINAQKDWQFVLVVTNPKDQPIQAKTTSSSKAREFLEKSKQLIGLNDGTLLEASFIYAWIATEASLRLLMRRSGEQNRPQQSTLSLIRDAAIIGELDREDAQHLEKLYKLRSSIMHAVDDSAPSANDVQWLSHLANSILRNHP
jgi:hypothetical protein